VQRQGGVVGGAFQCWHVVPAAEFRLPQQPPEDVQPSVSATRNTPMYCRLSMLDTIIKKIAFMFQVTNIPVKNYTLGVYFVKLIKKHILGGLLFLYSG
jgi:hypothetical protein